MKEQRDIVSEFLNNMDISGFETPDEFAAEQPDQEILYMWEGDVLHENE